MWSAELVLGHPCLLQGLVVTQCPNPASLEAICSRIETDTPEGSSWKGRNTPVSVSEDSPRPPVLKASTMAALSCCPIKLR